MIRQSFILALIGSFIITSPVLAQRGGGRGGPGMAASVFVAPVKEQEFSRQIEALGTLEPNERVELTLNAADRVTAIYFDDGERVKEGKTLLSLAQREQVALVEAAEATYEEARRQLERIERLARDNAVSQSELDEAQRNAESAEANLRAVQSRQADRVLIAPFDGVLGFRRVSLGSYVRPGDVVATLIDDSIMRLEFSVPSTFLASLQQGVEVVATTAVLPDQQFKGQITSLDNAIDPVTRSVRVRATLPNPDRVLKAGMFMSVIIKADPKMNLAIPEEAVQPLGPKNYAWVATQEGDQLVARRHEIVIGIRAPGYVEVISGLTEGDRVITEGVIRVREGAPVVIRDEAMLQPQEQRDAPPAAVSTSAAQ